MKPKWSIGRRGPEQPKDAQKGKTGIGRRGPEQPKQTSKGYDIGCKRAGKP